MTAWRPDPFLLRFLDAAEQELASALELHHRRSGTGAPDESPVLRTEREKITTLCCAVDALHAALERPEAPIFH